MNNYNLHSAVRSDNYSDVVSLVKAGLDVNEQDFSGFTPVHIAVACGNEQIVQFLISEGADIEIRDFYELFQPIHAAAKEGHLQIVKLLLDHGACPDDYARFGYLPLHVAAEGGHVNIIRYFLDMEMEVDVWDYQNSTPLISAASWGRKEAVEFLLSNGANINHKDDSECTPLHRASLHGHLEVVKLLIEKGALLDQKGDKGRTCLHMAVEKGHKNIVELIIASGATYALTDGTDNVNLLYVAAEFGKTDIVEYFMEIGDFNEFKDLCIRNILYIAAQGGHEKLVEFLINKGADVNSKCLAKGNTPLHYSSQNCHPKVTELLIQNGCHIEANNYVGLTPLDLIFKEPACPSDQRDVVNIFSKYLLLQNKNMRANFLDDFVPSDFRYRNELINFWYSCKKEIQEMDSIRLTNTNISLGKALRAMFDETKLAIYLCNENNVKNLAHIENDCKDFTIYANISGMMKHKIGKAVQRQQLMQQAILAMDNFTPKLPTECKLKIFNYLSSEELIIFVRCF